MGAVRYGKHIKQLAEQWGPIGSLAKFLYVDAIQPNDGPWEVRQKFIIAIYLLIGLILIAVLVESVRAYVLFCRDGRVKADLDPGEECEQRWSDAVIGAGSLYLSILSVAAFTLMRVRKKVYLPLLHFYAINAILLLLCMTFMRSNTPSLLVGVSIAVLAPHFSRGKVYWIGVFVVSIAVVGVGIYHEATANDVDTYPRIEFPFAIPQSTGGKTFSLAALAALCLAVSAHFIRLQDGYDRSVEFSEAADEVTNIIVDQLQRYDTAAVRATLNRSVGVLERGFLTSMETLVDNLDNYRPFLPNYVLPEFQERRNESSVGVAAESSDQVTEPALRFVGPQSSPLLDSFRRGPRGWFGRSATTASDMSDGAESKLSDISEEPTLMVTDLDGDVALSANSSVNSFIPHSAQEALGNQQPGGRVMATQQTQAENFRGLRQITYTELDFCKITQHTLHSKGTGGFKDVETVLDLLMELVQETATTTHASIHNAVGDLLSVSWNATHKVVQPEVKAIRFLQTLRAGFSGSHLLSSCTMSGAAWCHFSSSVKHKTLAIHLSFRAAFNVLLSLCRQYDAFVLDDTTYTAASYCGLMVPVDQLQRSELPLNLDTTTTGPTTTTTTPTTTTSAPSPQPPGAKSPRPTRDSFPILTSFPGLGAGGPLQGARGSVAGSDRSSSTVESFPGGAGGGGGGGGMQGARGSVAGSEKSSSTAASSSAATPNAQPLASPRAMLPKRTSLNRPFASTLYPEPQYLSLCDNAHLSPVSILELSAPGVNETPPTIESGNKPTVTVYELITPSKANQPSTTTSSGAPVSGGNAVGDRVVRAPEGDDQEMEWMYILDEQEKSKRGFLTAFESMLEEDYTAACTSLHAAVASQTAGSGAASSLLVQRLQRFLASRCCSNPACREEVMAAGGGGGGGHPFQGGGCQCDHRNSTTSSNVQ